jgi:hypothetical protein
VVARRLQPLEHSAWYVQSLLIAASMQWHTGRGAAAAAALLLVVNTVTAVMSIVSSGTTRAGAAVAFIGSALSTSNTLASHFVPRHPLRH